MVFKKSFTLLVATGTTPFFALVSTISDSNVWEYILCQFLTPWNILENKYFQILIDKRAFLPFSRTFTKIFHYFPWKSKFSNVDNIEN